MRLRVFSLMLLFFNQIFCQDTVTLELKIDGPLMPEDQNSVKIYDSKIGLIKVAKIGSIVEIDIYQYPTKLFFLHRRISCYWIYFKRQTVKSADLHSSK